MTTKTDEQERADFERHWHEFYKLGIELARINGRYLSPAAQRAWEAWQARAAIEADRKRRGEDQQPFGYFRPMPFGWTDCAATDEGAIALYERPQAQGEPKDRRDIRGIVKKLQTAYVKDGSTDEWIRLRRHVLEQAIDTLRLASADCAHFYDAYKAACDRAAPQPAEPVKPTAPFDDPRVQTVYGTICGGHEPPEGKHWDGYVSRLIVDALFHDEPVKVPSDDLAHEIWAAAQTAPGEGIEGAVERVAALLARYTTTKEQP